MYSYRKDRDSFLQWCGEHGIRDDAYRLLSAATTIQRVSELVCSVDMGERETARQERRSDNAAKRAARIAAKYNMTIDDGGDPRGYTLTIKGEGFERGIPGRPFPASVYARW